MGLSIHRGGRKEDERAPESDARASYTSSMHLSRVLSPVKPEGTPSDFIVRAFSDGPLGVFGVAGPFDATDAFLTVRRMNSPVNRGKYHHIPAVFTPTAGFPAPPAFAFACSTSVFHCFTISFARSDTSFDACVRSLPTASPALLSWK